jgi:hypothetical protein
MLRKVVSKSFSVPRSPWLSWLLLSLLLGTVLVFQVIAISRKSLSNDEIAHIPAGYYYWSLEDFQFNNEHPPLAKLWATMPLLFILDGPDSPLNVTDPTSRWNFYGQFWQQYEGAFSKIEFWPRFLMLPFQLLLGLLLFQF